MEKKSFSLALSEEGKCKVIYSDIQRINCLYAWISLGPVIGAPRTIISSRIVSVKDFFFILTKQLKQASFAIWQNCNYTSHLICHTAISRFPQGTDNKPNNLFSSI